jgi:hypothetical protein
LVVLTVLAAIKNRKTNDENLIKLKIDLFRRLHESNLDKTTMRALANFIKMYVRFYKPESYRIFKTEIQMITNNKSTMGIEELILQHTKAEGKAEVVGNLIVKLGLSDEQAADVAGVTVEFVKQLRARLKG